MSSQVVFLVRSHLNVRIAQHGVNIVLQNRNIHSTPSVLARRPAKAPSVQQPYEEQKSPYREQENNKDQQESRWSWGKMLGFGMLLGIGISVFDNYRNRRHVIGKQRPDGGDGSVLEKDWKGQRMQSALERSGISGVVIDKKEDENKDHRYDDDHRRPYDEHRQPYDDRRSYGDDRGNYNDRSYDDHRHNDGRRNRYDDGGRDGYYDRDRDYKEQDGGRRYS
eukprot:m.341111 g.341111  ORF g.341111 m.341111 type:complete len:222 (+) comp19828_c0_seq1:145-810(+)